MSLLIQFFLQDHINNIEGAKFLIGDKVRVSNHLGVFEGAVLGVAWVSEDDGFEYAVESMDYLCWESEMEKLS